VLWIRIGFNADPAFFVNADTDTDPDPDPNPGFDDQKLEKKITAEKMYIFLNKNCNLLIPIEVFIPQKRTSSTSKLEFSSLLWVILFLLSWIRIRIPNADPDTDPSRQNECGSLRIPADPDSQHWLELLTQTIMLILNVNNPRQHFMLCFSFLLPPLWYLKNTMDKSRLNGVMRFFSESPVSARCFNDYAVSARHVSDSSVSASYVSDLLVVGAV
jgi:hypothetical protein